jgi:hypothetical protein
MADSAYTDRELGSWLRFEEKHGNSFMRAIAEAAFIADTPSYRLLRPVLLRLKGLHPQG